MFHHHSLSRAVAGLVFVLTAPLLSATTRYVWSGGNQTPPYTNWAMAARLPHLAANLSQDDDTVLITNGTYLITSSVNVTNAVTVRSVNGRDTVTLNANAGRRVVYMTHAGGIVDGLTMTNGYNGGGGGAGVYMTGGLVRNSRILKNNSPSGGGGIRMTGGVVSNCVVQANRAPNTGDGGGIYVSGGSVVNCEIQANTSGTNAGFGGGVYMSGGALANCTVGENTASPRGGGLYITASVTVRNTLVHNNTTDADGGGVAVYNNSKPLLVGCTIASNHAVSLGGGIWYDQASTRVGVTNSIIWYNTAATGPDAYGAAGAMVAGWCCAPAPVVTHGVNGNTTNTPRFVNPSMKNFRLMEGSPCVNTGTNIQGLLDQADLDGGPRVRFARTDIGAYELWYASKGSIFCLL